MFFIIQIALPRDRVFCGYSNTERSGLYEARWNNETTGHAVAYATRDEADEECAKHPGAVVAELVFAE